MTAGPVDHERLTDFCATVLQRVGVSPEDARICAGSLVLADMRGVGTHGVRRLESYVRHLQSGYYRADAQPALVRKFPAGAVFDGRHALGQVTANRALDFAMEQARRAGAACIAIRN